MIDMIACMLGIPRCHRQREFAICNYCNSQSERHDTGPIYRCGWAESSLPLKNRFGRWWIWIGPYVIGDLRRF